MARIAGVNIPTNKRVIIALTYIHGIGRKTAADIDWSRLKALYELTKPRCFLAKITLAQTALGATERGAAPNILFVLADQWRAQAFGFAGDPNAQTPIIDRLAADVKKLCTEHLTFFAAPAPFARYVFLLHVGDKLYGGLEHRASTALMASRDALPVQGEATPTEAYLDLLALFSHEYFHAWNVKRIKPAAFVPYDLS